MKRSKSIETDPETKAASRVKARRRARRAAQVATIGLALMGGCAEVRSTEQGAYDYEDCDAQKPFVDAAYHDASAKDAATKTADAGTDAVFADCSSFVQEEPIDWEGRRACCEKHDWDWNVPGCAAWGPYVAPGSSEQPASRAVAIRVAVERALMSQTERAVS